MTIKDKISELIKEPVSRLVEQASGWHVVQREQDIKSTRYSLGVFKEGFDFKAVLYDFKKGKKIKTLHIEDIEGLKLIKSVKEKPIEGFIELGIVRELFDKGIKKDNSYLARKGLTSFNSKNLNVRNVSFRFDKSKIPVKNLLLIPYTNFHSYPFYVGGRLVDKRGKKFSVPGSRMTGSFHPHRLSTRIKNYIIGEGYPECFIAMNLLNEFNVLEAGGCGNVGNILKYLTQDEDNIIYVMAENGSEEVYDRLSDLYPTVRFTYPPDKSHKDFGDYFLEYTAEKTKEAILGYMVEQSGLGYKPLGILNNLHYPVFYSKLINNIVKKSTDSTESIYRLAVDSNPASIHEKKQKNYEGFS